LKIVEENEFIKYLKTLTKEEVKIGNKIKCLNPEHKESHNSLVIYENNAFCFGCGYYIQLGKKPRKENAKEKLYRLFIERCSKEDIKDWAKERGYDIKLLKELKIGLCNSEVMSDLIEEVGKESLMKHKIIKNGKHIYYNRIIIPFGDYYFAARHLDKTNTFKNLFPIGLNKEPYFIKGKGDICYITEGETDAITLKHIYPNANIFSIGGTSSFKLLERLNEFYSGEKIIYCYDNDAVGKKCLFDSSKKLELRYNQHQLMFPPEYKDIDEAYYNQKEKIKDLVKEEKVLEKVVYIEDEHKDITKEEYRKIIIKNFPMIWIPLDVCISGICVLKLKDWTDPIGINIIGAPSSQKTTILSFFYGLNDLIFKSDNITPKSFVSHSNVTDIELEKIDLLPKIKDMAFIIPELAPIFGKRKEDLIENMSIITRIFDGEGFESDSGTKGHRGYSGEYLFTWLGASTPLEDRVWKTMGKLGARWFFIYLSEKHEGEEELKSIITSDNIYGKKIIECREATHRYLKTIFKDGLKRNIKWDNTKIPDEIAECIVKCAQILKLLRGSIQMWENQDGSYEYRNILIEEPYRIISILTTIAKGHAISEGRNELIFDDFLIILLIVFSSMPEERRVLFELLLKNIDNDITHKDIEIKLKCSQRTAYKTIKELTMLGIIQQTSSNYSISDDVKNNVLRLKELLMGYMVSKNYNKYIIDFGHHSILKAFFTLENPNSFVKKGYKEIEKEEEIEDSKVSENYNVKQTLQNKIIGVLSNQELSTEEMMVALNISYGELYPILMKLKESGDIWEPVKKEHWRLLK